MLGNWVKQIFTELVEVYGSHNVSYAAVRRWRKNVHAFSEFVIVRPANRDWTCQTERCHTLSNKTSLQ